MQFPLPYKKSIALLHVIRNTHIVAVIEKYYHFNSLSYLFIETFPSALKVQRYQASG